MSGQAGTDLLRGYFLETAADGAPAGLLERSLAQTAAVRQRRPWWVRATRWSTPGRALRPATTALLVVALVGLLLLGGVVVGGLISPAPTSTPEASTSALSATPVPGSQRVAAFRFPFTAVLPEDARFVSAVPDRDAAQMRVGGTSEAEHGIWIMVVEPGWVHTCFNGETRVRLGSTPLDVLTTMREAGGIELSVPESTSVDGRPGYAADMNPALSTCGGNEFHPGDEPEGIEVFAVDIEGPARLITVEVLDRTVMLMLWAGSDAALDAWLPSAQALVDSIRFEAPPSPGESGATPTRSPVRVDAFVRPFDYVPGPYVVSPGSIERDLVVWRGRGVQITIASAETMWVHGCGTGTEPQFVGHGPEAFFADLRDVAGFGLGEDSEWGKLDGRLGRWANVFPELAACSGDVHLSGPIVDEGAGLGERLFDRPGRIIAADVAGATVFVVISAPTLDEVSAEMWDVLAFVDEIEFLDRSDLEAPG